jgi:hypothetical protein
MPCENYREALTEAAAASAAPAGELRLHLDVCVSCRAAFTEEQQLFAVIDGGVRATANAEVPASLLPRVRTQLSERALPQRTWIAAAAAIATTAALILLGIFVRQSWRGGALPTPSAISAADNIVPAGMGVIPPAVASTGSKGLSGRVSPTLSVKSVRVPDGKDVTVLIPPGQKRAIEALFASIQQNTVEENVLRTEKPEEALHELRISPLEISPIEVKPLADVSSESPSEDEETRP